jgi:hypothetical protein
VTTPSQQLEQAFQIVGLEFGEFARGELKPRVLGVETLGCLAEQPGDADVIDLGKPGSSSAETRRLPASISLTDGRCRQSILAIWPCDSPAEAAAESAP